MNFLAGGDVERLIKASARTGNLTIRASKSKSHTILRHSSETKGPIMTIIGRKRRPTPGPLTLPRPSPHRRTSSRSVVRPKSLHPPAAPTAAISKLSANEMISVSVPPLAEGRASDINSLFCWRSRESTPPQSNQWLTKKWDTKSFHGIIRLFAKSVPLKCPLSGVKRTSLEDEYPTIFASNQRYDVRYWHLAHINLRGGYPKALLSTHQLGRFGK